MLSINRLLTLLLLVCLPWICQADTAIVVGQPPVVAGADCVTCEDFEGTGAPTNWTNTITSWDYTTAPAPLEAAQSARLRPTETTTYDPSYASANTWWGVWFAWNQAIENTEVFAQVQSSAPAVIATFSFVVTNNDFTCLAAGGTANTGGTFPNDTSTMKIKLQYVQGSGSNAAARLWTWNGSGWDLQCESTNGTSTAAIDSVVFTNGANTEELIMDVFKDKQSDITSPDL